MLQGVWQAIGWLLLKGEKKGCCISLQGAFCIHAGKCRCHWCSSTSLLQRVMDKTASAYENKMPFRNTLEEFLNFTLQ